MAWNSDGPPLPPPRQLEMDDVLEHRGSVQSLEERAFSEAAGLGVVTTGPSQRPQAVTVVSPLHDAAARGDVGALVRALTSLSVEETSSGHPCEPDSLELIDKRDHAQNTPLHWASGAGQLVVMAYLIEKGASLDAKNLLGDTPLHRSVWRQQVEAVRALVAAGADDRIKNERGMTPRDLARGERVEELKRIMGETTTYSAIEWGKIRPGDHIILPEGLNLSPGESTDEEFGNGFSSDEDLSDVKVPAWVAQAFQSEQVRRG